LIHAQRHCLPVSSGHRDGGELVMLHNAETNAGIGFNSF